MNTIDVKQLSLVTQQALELSERASLTPREKRRLSTLTATMAAIKAGATVNLDEIEENAHNEEEKRAGLPVTNFGRGRSLLSPEKRSIAREWQAAVIEKRDMVEGNPIPRIGTYAGLGTFVPTSFYQNLFSAMKTHDPLYDEDSVTLIKSTNGRVLTIPTLGDVSNVAEVIGEAVQDSSTDISNVGQALVAAYSYRTPRFTASIEAFQDVESAGGLAQMFENFAADRLARGVSADLVNGNGSSKTLGLVPSVIALASTATPIITAIGAADNTGGSALGIGSEDLANLYFSVDAAYRASSKAAWLMADDTLRQLSGVVTKMGLPLINVVNGVPTLHGKPVKVSPSMQIISNGNYPVLFGDLSYWVTRLVVSDDSYIKLIFDAPGLAEQGKFAMRAYLRADGALAFTSQTDPSPVNILRCSHS